MKFLDTALALTLAARATAQDTTADECISHSQPNPIWQQYPGNVTGTINGTLALIPIPFSLARKIIPAQYNILSHQWRTLLPELGEDMYPAIYSSVRDHDVRFGEYTMPDFSRASIEFPFVDLFGDGVSSYNYIPTMLISATATMAIDGARAYGKHVYPSTCEPSCNGYEHSPTSQDETYFRVQSEEGKESLDATYTRLDAAALRSHSVPTAFFLNATAQPIFGDGKGCDNYIRLFNTSLTAGTYAATPVLTDLSAKLPAIFGADTRRWQGAVGLQMHTPFVENHLVSCESMQGWQAVQGQRISVRGVSAGYGEQLWTMLSWEEAKSQAGRVWERVSEQLPRLEL